MSDPRDDLGDDLLGGPVAPDVADDQATDAPQGTGEYGAAVDRDTGADVGDTGEPELEGHSPS